ncbi:hypothetical protein GWI33_009783 [Rhynchophorus ferrugineus]|uniref:Uncharacterized protein n=1 Tax=Rhynchophorus ferrugineus TaxID=354439 RepID=A0A834IR46_RHYFE|nr:hypothetical protein GWI33_009783 [Rhynchophorus ferrugineus]
MIIPYRSLAQKPFSLLRRAGFPQKENNDARRPPQPPSATRTCSIFSFLRRTLDLRGGHTWTPSSAGQLMMSCKPNYSRIDRQQPPAVSQKQTGPEKYEEPNGVPHDPAALTDHLLIKYKLQHLGPHTFCPLYRSPSIFAPLRAVSRAGGRPQLWQGATATFNCRISSDNFEISQLARPGMVTDGDDSRIGREDRLALFLLVLRINLLLVLLCIRIFPDFRVNNLYLLKKN